MADKTHILQELKSATRDLQRLSNLLPSEDKIDRSLRRSTATMVTKLGGFAGAVFGFVLAASSGSFLVIGGSVIVFGGLGTCVAALGCRMLGIQGSEQQSEDLSTLEPDKILDRLSVLKTIAGTTDKEISASPNDLTLKAKRDALSHAIEKYEEAYADRLTERFYVLDTESSELDNVLASARDIGRTVDGDKNTATANRKAEQTR